MPQQRHKSPIPIMQIAGDISIDGEQTPNASEDAGLAVYSENAGLFACADGCGGAGARRYAQQDNWTGARLAARILCNVVTDWAERYEILQNGIGNAPAANIADSLHAAISKEFGAINSRLGSETVLRGQLSKALPTTFVSVIVDTFQFPARNVFLWAGDSRAYLFTLSGLRQMTADDVLGGMDAMDNLRNDGVLTNLISASGDFAIHVCEARLRAPYLAITATDGCFSYFRSPIEFESMLLRTLMAAQSPDRWRQLLTEAIRNVASDDYTLRIAMVGFSSFAQLKAAFQAREATFHSMYRLPLEQLLRQNDMEGLARLWRQYKIEYEEDMGK